MKTHTLKRTGKDQYEISPRDTGLLEISKHVIQALGLQGSKPSAEFCATSPRIFICSSGAYGQVPGDLRPSMLEYLVVHLPHDTPDFAALSQAVALARPELNEATLHRLWQSGSGVETSAPDEPRLQQTAPYESYVPPAAPPPRFFIPPIVALASVLGLSTVCLGVHDVTQARRSARLTSQTIDLKVQLTAADRKYRELDADFRQWKADSESQLDDKRIALEAMESKLQETMGNLDLVTQKYDALGKQIDALKRQIDEKRRELANKAEHAPTTTNSTNSKYTDRDQKRTPTVPNL